jgi:hypothetical protein
MRLLHKMSFLVLASGLAFGQAANPPADDPNSVAAQIKAMREALAAQQQQIAQQQQQIERLQKQVADKPETAAIAPDSTSARVVDASLRTAGPVNVAARPLQDDKKESPLSFRIGAAEFTPGGFVDFENVFRSTNTGFVTATNFWAIPFSNTVQGHLTEYRSTGQYSRFNIKTHAKYGENDITGYVEFDFNGNDAANVFVTSNPHTDRMRLYWLDLKRGKWEFLGGQTWGLQSPNRAGLSPNPSDIFTTLGEDAQTHVGVNYTRAAEFRATYHINDNFQWAAAIQNPQQFGGQGAEVVFPNGFNGALTGGVGQVDQGASPGAPNVAPDVLTKFAYDKSYGGRQFHLEAGGLMTTAKVTVVPTGGTTFASHSTVGGGFNGGLNVELWKGSDNRNINFVGYGMWGYGIGRYLIGTGPQFVVAPVTGTAPITFDVRTSGVHAGDVVTGFEFRPHAKSQFGVYYGGTYFQRNTFPDLTAANTPNLISCAPGLAATLKPCAGFGGFGEANASVQNRSIQEGTIDWTQTFWKNPQYGALLLVTQASYVTRSPWFVANGAPKNAHLGMGYLSLRYVLP